MTDNDNDKQNDFKVPHRKSPNYISDYATGTIISGPTNDGFYHLIFYSDAVSINSETGITAHKLKDAKGAEYEAYQLGISTGDVEDFREDKAKIAMSKESVIALLDLLKKQISDTDIVVSNNERQ